MEKRLMTMLVGLFLLVGGVLAQTKVSGTVVSQEDEQPVVGASILVVGTNVGTVTNANGQFSLTVPEGKKTLRVTYIGMQTQEVSIRPNMRIVLANDETTLGEVVITGYGVTRKAAFTGAASTLNADKIANKTDANPIKALEGAVTGLQLPFA